MRVLSFLNNPKDLDPSYKMDLDFWDCFGRKKNTVLYPKKYGTMVSNASQTIKLIWADTVCSEEAGNNIYIISFCMSFDL